jgi:hypothetical protein
MTRVYSFTLFVALTACKTEKVETKESAKPSEASPAPAAADPKPDDSKPADSKPAAGSSEEYVHTDPAFKLRLPAGFEADAPFQSGPGNTSLRFAKPGEHTGIGTFVSVTWWKKEPGAYAQLASQMTARAKTKLDEKAIAGGKGKAVYGSATASRMIEGNLQDAKQYVGAAAVEGKDVVLTCVVESFDEPPRPAFIRACETLSLE